MAPRNPELPEGTDKIISGASADGSSGGERGFVARGSGNDNGGATDRLVSQVRDQVSNLRGQAGEKLRGFADDGKGRATTLLEDVASVIDDAARSIDERLGAEIGGYAHRASDAISGFAGRVREKSVDDIVEDTRSLVKSSPGIAIAAAAVIGFALVRVARSGLGSDGEGGGRSRGKGRGRGAGSSEA
jgi:ElaB/YqjD/DUF883 family membrane-anchored ribosome-binding protein